MKTPDIKDIIAALGGDSPMSKFEKNFPAEAALARLRNRENGLPPALEKFLAEQCRDDDERAHVLKIVDAMLLAQARQDFDARYADDFPDDDDDVSIADMERLAGEEARRKQQQSGN